MKSFQIVTSDHLLSNVESWRRDGNFPDIDAHPIYGEFGRAYYPAVFGERRQDKSFAVTDRDGPLIVVACTRGDGELDYYGAPVRLFLRSGLTGNDAQRAVAVAFSHLDTLAADGGPCRVTVRDDSCVGILSLVGKQCLNRRGAAALRLSGLCALDGGEAAMRRSLRKSFQSLVNWGQRNLKVVSIDSANPDRVLFKAYQDFHAAVAGRVTRSEQSWDVMRDWIVSGRGELILGYLESGELVTGTMVADGAVASFYASGVYDRGRFDQPLGHWPLWLAMQHSAGRGKRVFDLGDLPLVGAASDKEVSIGYFKRGFATDIETWIAWSWTAAAGPAGLPV